MIYKDNRFGYVDNGEETPGNIPNPAVKLSRGENSARATWCQNSKMYLLLKNPSGNTGVFFCLNFFFYNSFFDYSVTLHLLLLCFSIYSL